MCQISAGAEPFCCFHDTHTQFTLGWTSCGEGRIARWIRAFFFFFPSVLVFHCQHNYVSLSREQGSVIWCCGEDFSFRSGLEL